MPTTLTVRDPFREMRSFMRHAFDDNLLGWFDDLPSGGGRPLRSHTIPLDIFESQAGLTVSALLPGFTSDDVEVTLEKGKLSIRAEKSAQKSAEKSADEKQEEDRTYFLRERSHGVSARSILIGDSYDPDSIEGSLKDGVLTIAVRKVPQAQPKRVAISAG